MRHLRRTIALGLIGTLVVLAGWWYGWPLYQRRCAEGDIARGDLGTAEKRLAALLRTTSDYAQAQFLYAQVLRKLKRFGEAQAALARALSVGLANKVQTRR